MLMDFLEIDVLSMTELYFNRFMVLDVTCTTSLLNPGPYLKNQLNSMLGKVSYFRYDNKSEENQLQCV